jgi:hypothetical protein
MIRDVALIEEFDRARWVFKKGASPFDQANTQALHGQSGLCANDTNTVAGLLWHNPAYENHPQWDI